MDNYPQNHWTDEDVDKMKSSYFMTRAVKCPVCEEQVVIEKQEGEEHLKKKYIDTYFFLVFECKGCSRRTTKTYRKSP